MSCRTTCCRWRPSISLCGGTCNPGERVVRCCAASSLDNIARGRFLLRPPRDETPELRCAAPHAPAEQPPCRSPSHRCAVAAKPPLTPPLRGTSESSLEKNVTIEKLRQRLQPPGPRSPPKKPFRLHRTSRVLPPPCQPERGGSPHGPWRPSSSRQRLLLSLAETAGGERCLGDGARTPAQRKG